MPPGGLIERREPNRGVVVVGFVLKELLVDQFTMCVEPGKKFLQRVRKAGNKKFWRLCGDGERPILLQGPRARTDGRWAHPPGVSGALDEACV